VFLCFSCRAQWRGSTWHTRRRRLWTTSASRWSSSCSFSSSGQSTSRVSANCRLTTRYHPSTRPGLHGSAWELDTADAVNYCAPTYTKWGHARMNNAASLFVCPSAGLFHAHSSKTVHFSYICCLWPRLGVSLTAMQYVMYFRLNGWRHVFL